jgi:hypothetical protein
MGPIIINIQVRLQTVLDPLGPYSLFFWTGCKLKNITVLGVLGKQYDGEGKLVVRFWLSAPF